MTQNLFEVGNSDQMTFWRINYHFVWGTKYREAVLLGENAETAIKAIRAEAKELRSIIHAVAIQPEHVHVAISSPPVYSPAQIAKQLKGKSSHLLNRVWNPDGVVEWSGWQSEYGILTVGDRSTPPIVQYVNNQEEHHRSQNLWPNFEDLGGPPESAPNLEEVS
jgi:putative transposase